MEAKDNNVSKAVVGMDGKQSEVGDSNGRSGKSLIGELMRCAIPTAYIPGKRSDLFNDQFVWNDVLENTKLVFIDDVLQNFNFEFLFPNITGDWSVNYKGGRRITIPFSASPKSTLPPTMQFVVVAPALLIDSGSLPSLIITTIHVSLLMTLVHSFSPNGISTNGISLGTYWPTAYSSIFSLESCKLQENDSNNGSFAKKWAKPSYPGQTNISPQMNI